jgi:hypothetical protein
MKPHELTSKIRVVGRTSPEISEAFGRLVLAMERAGLTFRNRKVTAEAVLNAIVIGFLDLPADQQEAAIRLGVERFGRNLMGTPLADTRPESRVKHGDPVGESPPPPPPRKRNSRRA